MKLSLKITLGYFILSNLIFLGGVLGKMDAFVWGFLSFIIDWPFSQVAHKVQRLIEGTPPSIDNSHAAFLGLSAAQWLIYSFDVVAGTAWWWILALVIIPLRGRSRSGGNAYRA